MAGEQAICGTDFGNHHGLSWGDCIQTLLIFGNWVKTERSTFGDSETRMDGFLCEKSDLAVRFVCERCTDAIENGRRKRIVSVGHVFFSSGEHQEFCVPARSS